MRELAILLNAKIPLVTALGMLEESTPTPKIKKIFNQVKQEVSGGLSLSQSLAKYPRQYSVLTCQLIQAGERSAALPKVLENMADYEDKLKNLKSTVLKSLFYPTVVLVISVMISIALMLFIVPQFQQLFDSAGADLPILTKNIIVISEILKKYGLLFLGLLFLLGFMAYRSKLFLKFPFIQKTYQKFMLANMTRTVAMLLSAGVPLAEALKYAGQPHLREKILRGEMFSNALQSMGGFSSLVIQMIRVGEASGELNAMLLRIAMMSEAELDKTLSRFTQCLEPAIMIFMGVFVGGLVLAMYLPIFQLGRVV